MSPTNIIKDLIVNGTFDYGSTIDLNEYLSLFSIEPLQEKDAKDMTFPEVKKRWQEDALKELNVVDMARDALLKEGRYLQKQGDLLRVCIPSENQGRIDAYMSAGARKYKKAQVLLKNSPKDVIEQSGHTAARLMLAEKSAAKKYIRH